MHKCRLQILMSLLIHGLHFNQWRTVLSPDGQSTITYWEKKVISLDLSHLNQFQIVGKMREKFLSSPFLYIFAGILVSLSMAGVFLTSFSTGLCSEQREMFPSEVSPLLMQKSISPQKSVLCGNCLQSLYFPLGIHGIKEYFPDRKTSKWSNMIQIQKEKMTRPKKRALHSHQKAGEHRSAQWMGPAPRTRGSRSSGVPEISGHSMSQICKMGRKEP